MKKTVLSVCAFLMIGILAGCSSTAPGSTPAQPTQETVPTPEMAPLPTQANLWYVIYEDGGVAGELIGCNDSLVGFSTSFPQYTSWSDLLTDLYTQLINAYGLTGLMETTIPPTLQINQIIVAGSTASVSLSGTLLPNGVCDLPRIQEQLTRIATQFPAITQVDITMNGISLKDYLSLQ